MIIKCHLGNSLENGQQQDICSNPVPIFDSSGIPVKGSVANGHARALSVNARLFAKIQCMPVARSLSNRQIPACPLPGFYQTGKIKKNTFFPTIFHDPFFISSCMPIAHACNCPPVLFAKLQCLLYPFPDIY